MEDRALRNKLAEAGYEMMVEEVRDLVDLSAKLQSLAMEPQAVLMEIFDTDSAEGLILFNAIMRLKEIGRQ